jgi:hypothetical protein
MTKSAYIDEILGNINGLEFDKVIEISNYVKYIKYQEILDPTLEIASNQDWMKAISKGLQESVAGEVLDWDSVK